MQDHHRLRSTQTVYAAPLPAAAQAAKDAGSPASVSGFRNLLTPRWKNSVGAQRGLVAATLARTSKCYMKSHAPDFWSATLMKWALQSLTVANARFPGCAGQLHMDDMAKVPLLSAARPRSNPKGWSLKREDGRPAFVGQDHDFSIGQNMYLNTTGVFTCQGPETTLPLGMDKPQIPYGTKRAATHLYLRPHRYVPVSDHTHMADLHETVGDSPELQAASLTSVWTAAQASQSTARSSSISFTEHGGSGVGPRQLSSHRLLITPAFITKPRGAGPSPEGP